MDHLVAGMGEVGTALVEVMTERGLSVQALDPRLGVAPTGSKFDVAHACFPHDGWFARNVRTIKSTYGATLVVVHSTVPLGTTDEINDGEDWAVHSPVRGVHPHLAEGIRKFPKYFGGKRAEEAARIFEEQVGIETRSVEDSRVTEALKLWDTTQYGWMIALEKEMHVWCVANFGADRADAVMDEIYVRANKQYDDCYRMMGRPEVARPYLTHREGPIGGHCVIPNARMLSRGADDELLPKFLLLLNEMWAKEED